MALPGTHRQRQAARPVLHLDISHTFDGEKHRWICRGATSKEALHGKRTEISIRVDQLQARYGNALEWGDSEILLTP
jgi:hypothetical protein